MSQVRKLEAEQKDLRAKATAHVRAGNNSAAGQYALRLQSVDAQLAENRVQLEQAETTYKNLVKARDVAVQTARAKIESLKGAINDMRMKQAMAELHEMSAGMITTIGDRRPITSARYVEEDATSAAAHARQGLHRHAASTSRIRNDRAPIMRWRFRRARGILKGAKRRAGRTQHGRHRSRQPLTPRIDRP